MPDLLPLFPLQLVVFPAENLNLHIFEPRYQELIKDCEEEEITLTIILDKTDFEQAITPQLNKQLSSAKIEGYLFKNMTWIFNKEKAEIEICTIEQVKDHYEIKAHFEKGDKYI